MNPRGYLAQKEAADQAKAITVTVVITVINLTLMTYLVSAFSVGPYSSFIQEIHSPFMLFLVFGAILPSAALVLWAYRSCARLWALIAWMIAALTACFGYAVMSGGGM